MWLLWSWWDWSSLCCLYTSESWEKWIQRGFHILVSHTGNSVARNVLVLYPSFFREAKKKIWHEEFITYINKCKVNLLRNFIKRNIVVLHALEYNFLVHFKNSFPPIMFAQASRIQMDIDNVLPAFSGLPWISCYYSDPLLGWDVWGFH